MPRSAAKTTANPESRRGFAVLLVLWTLLLMALIAARMTLAGRAEADGATRLKLAASAEAAADGAVYEAIFHVMQKDLHWQLDRQPHKLAIGTVAVDVRLEDETGKINPNVATPELLSGLLVAIGTNNARAQSLGRAIVEWRNTKPTAEEVARSAAAYRMDGLDYAPAHQPFHALEELGAVIGMSPVILKALMPHLTLSDDKGPTAGRADPMVRIALKLANMPPGTAAESPDQRVFAVIASANGPHDIKFRRRAVIQANSKGTYSILGWDLDLQR